MLGSTKSVQIRQLRAAGASYAEIAQQVGLSVHGVRYHLTETRKERNILRIADHRRRLKCKAVDFSGGACLKCGYNRSEAGLDFHHVDPTKKDLQIASGMTRSWDAILPELRKTILLCKVCHSELHYGDWELGTDIIEKQQDIRAAYIDRPLADYGFYNRTDSSTGRALGWAVNHLVVGSNPTLGDQ